VGADRASGAELAGSESRADVALKDESAGIEADFAAKVQRMIEEANIKLKACQALVTTGLSRTPMQVRKKKKGSCSRNNSVPY
jgi:hypothetical protein